MKVSEARKYFKLRNTDTVYLEGIKDIERGANRIISYSHDTVAKMKAWKDLEACRALRTIAVY